MNIEEIRGLATDELIKAEDNAREELFRKRYASALESLEHTRELRDLRKRVARIKTVLRERQLAEQKAPQPQAAGQES